MRHQKPVFACLMLLASVSFAEDPVAPTLEQIMADPDWIGNAPEGAYWSDDSRSVYFDQKRVGESIRDRFLVAIDDAITTPIAADAAPNDSNASRAYNAEHSAVVWVDHGDVFWRSLPDGPVQQLTGTAASERSVQWLLGERAVTYERDGQFYRHNLEGGTVHQLANLQFADDPNKAKPFDTLRENQRRIYTSVVEDKRRADARAAHDRAAQTARAGGAPLPIYLDKSLRPAFAVLSPTGQQIVVVTAPKDHKGGKAGIMPNYMTESGYTETVTLRTRVGRNMPAAHRVWLIDLNAATVTEVSLDDLPGIDDDPLENLRKSALEWHVERGADKAEVSKQLEASEQRAVRVEGVRWAPDGALVALQFHAVDNKDRWLATVDQQARLAVQHRLSDDAWINYAHNDFGWLGDGSGLWFLSEQSGYSHLYRKQLDARRAQALTAGDFVVSDVVADRNSDYLYFRANRIEPSIWEIHRVATSGGDIETLTALGGVNHFVLAPDAASLLVMHSEFDRHEDLFHVPVGQPDAATRLTDTVTPAFKSIDWVIPAIVKIPSSRVDRDIYSKLYLPDDYDPNKRYPAVMFVHGAGYTQNAYAGWPYYFREFMFHTLLAQQGVIVIDMDYRASKGYGRDWRTAIYRNMGRPELEDFQDGIAWLADNYNVDTERLGIYGGSYGGFMTFMAMFLDPDLFAAGAALRPVVDWSHYNHGYTSNILNTPLVDPEAFERSSPIFYADGLQKPLLIAAGMQDDNVFFQDSVLLVQRFLELQKEDFELAVYPLDPHGFTHADSWLDEYRRIYKLFDRHVF
ncbi:MAG: prolyl oligopeptidase family serine peptidase [Pseudomonadota bacterium]